MSAENPLLTPEDYKTPDGFGDRVASTNEAAYQAYAANLEFNRVDVHNEALRSVQESVEHDDSIWDAAVERKNATKQKVVKAALDSGDFRHISDDFSGARGVDHETYPVREREDLYSFSEVNREVVVREKEMDILRQNAVFDDRSRFLGFDRDEMRSLKPTSDEEREVRMRVAAEQAEADHGNAKEALKASLGPDDTI